MSVAERAPATHANIAPPSIDVGNAAAICFQSAGQVVTVLGKLDQHFYDNTDLADFTKRAVAEYAAKRETQIVAVVVTKNNASIAEDDATTHLSVEGQDYAVTIGDLRDGRTQMDHINRVIERLKYLQAVMVMLSTTDMLGTSQAVGKQMGGLNAKVQQVQKLGVKLEQFSKLVAQAQQEGKPLPAEALKPMVSQLNRLNTSANPPEIRKIVQTMLTQVKELRQLPIMRQDVGVAQATKTQLHIATKNDITVKTETRFKVPLTLVVSKDVAQQPHTPIVSSEPVKVTRHFTVLNPARTQQIHTRIVSAANVNQAARTQPVTSQVANDNRFRVVPQQLAKAIETRQVTAPVAERASIALTTTQRFSVVTDSIKQAPVLTTLAQASSAVSTPITTLPQRNAQISNGAVAQPVAPASQMIAQAVRQAEPVQAAPVQTVTVQTPNVVPSSDATVVPSVQATPVVQQINNQPVEAKAPTAQPNTSGVRTNPVAEAQPQRIQETQRSVEAARTNTHSEPQRSGTVPDGTTARSEPSQPVQPVSRLGGTQNGGVEERIVAPNPDNDNPTLREPQFRQAPADKAKQSGAEGRREPSTDETARLRTGDRNLPPQQPPKQEGDEKKDPKKTPPVVDQFNKCGQKTCQCANQQAEPSTRTNQPVSAPYSSDTGKAIDPVVVPIKDQIKGAAVETCAGGPNCPLCGPGSNAKTDTAAQLPVGEREFGRRTRRASAPQANAA